MRARIHVGASQPFERSNATDQHDAALPYRRQPPTGDKGIC